MSTDHALPNRLFGLCRIGFYLSLLLFFYGTLFPFTFDLSYQGLSEAWSNAGRVPYWDTARGRIHSLPDMASNVLLTVPLGFFGFLRFGQKRNRLRIAGWFVSGFLLGLLSEIVQLGIASRLSGITDALNNGLGMFLGAFIAAVCGSKILDLLSGSLFDKQMTGFLILAAIVTTTMLLPLDFGLDVSHIKSSIKALLANPWESGIPIDGGWILMAEFMLIGGMTGTMKRKQKKLILFAFLLPVMLEPAQLLVESHAPSVRDLAMNIAGVAGGFVSVRYIPCAARPITGFVLMNIALIAEGLGPYHFGRPSRFEWIPLVEYYNQTTGIALNDALSGILSYALLAALWPRWAVILWAALLASAIEATQIFIPARFAGITDVVIAAIGAWAGCGLAKANISAAENGMGIQDYQK
ncbi:MAG: VanZ family protein [Acidobacteria bacterium]|nr:VanZ family protein [Acidobacteriota bacterium]